MSLIIKKKQSEELDEVMTDRFAYRVTADLRRNQPQDIGDYTDEELMKFVKTGIRRAESYGMESDRDVARFVKLLFSVGWYFDEYELFRHFLTEEDYLPADRLPYLFDTATDEDWEAAADLSLKLQLEREENNQS